MKKKSRKFYIFSKSRSIVRMCRNDIKLTILYDNLNMRRVYSLTPKIILKQSRYRIVKEIGHKTYVF